MKWRAAREADRQVAELQKCALVTFAELATAFYAAEDKITDPRVRALMTTVTKDLLDRYHRHVAGFLEVAAEQAAQQINWDITSAPPGQLQRSSVRGAGVEQDAYKAYIRETLLDFLRNPFKLQVPEILPAIMTKEGERPAQEPGEHRTQPEYIGIPFRGSETLFRRDDEQALSNRVAELERQLAERGSPVGGGAGQAGALYGQAGAPAGAGQRTPEALARAKP